MPKGIYDRSKAKKRKPIDKRKGRISPGGVTDNPQPKREPPTPELVAQHPNMTLEPDNPMNQLELMTVDEMANMILSIDPEEKIKRINHFNLAILAISKHADRKNIASLWECFEAYVTLCSKTGYAMGNMSAYAAIGITKATADAWVHGADGSTPERQELITAIKRTCAMNRELLGAAGDINPVLTIFWQKNHDGFRDQQEHVVAQTNILGDRPDAKQLSDRYEGVIELDE